MTFIRRFMSIASEDTDVIFTSARLDSRTPHDRLSLWIRGKLSGELVLSRGDGEIVARALRLYEVAPVEDL